MNAASISPVYDVETAARLIGYEPTTKQLKQLQKFDTPPSALEHFVTFFDPGLSIMDLKEKLQERKKRVLYPQDWYGRIDFATAREKPQYRRLCIEALPDSFGKSIARQRALIRRDEQYIPATRVLITACVLHFLATGTRLFSKYPIRGFDKGPGLKGVNDGTGRKYGKTLERPVIHFQEQHIPLLTVTLYPVRHGHSDLGLDFCKKI